MKKRYRRRKAPKACLKCENYRHRWKYRFCFYTTCPYNIRDSTFRPKPLKKEYFPKKEVVK